MKKTIIKIDEEKCNGCGLCANACDEGAIGMVDGKAKLLNVNHCDGLGHCIPECPTDAITFDEVDVADITTNYDIPVGCPGMSMQNLKSMPEESKDDFLNEPESESASTSELMQWPVQINLVPVNAPYFDKADLLIAADCTAYAYGGFHRDMMKNRITLIGCPKLDPVDYSEKLTAIIKNNDIRSVSVVMMEVPCCGGMQMAAETAIKNSGKFIPAQVITISTNGEIIK